MLTVPFFIGSALGTAIGWLSANYFKKHMRLQAQSKSSSEM